MKIFQNIIRLNILSGMLFCNAPIDWMQNADNITHCQQILYNTFVYVYNEIGGLLQHANVRNTDMHEEYYSKLVKYRHILYNKKTSMDLMSQAIQELTYCYKIMKWCLS